jgi:nitroreductase
MTTPTPTLHSQALHAWAVDPADFPTGASLTHAIEFCLRYAVLAPSTHNTQPWWFVIEDNRVTIGLDVSRGLAMVDPEDREGIISVGAALFQLRLALAHFGFRSDVTFWPDMHDPAACAMLTITDTGSSVETEDPLFDAITRRHTSRAVFRDDPVPQADLDRLVAEAEAEGASLHLFTAYPDRHDLAKLISAADHVQMDDKRFRRELATWLRPAFSTRVDGIRGYGSDLSELMSIAAPVIVRTFDTGEGRAAKDAELATGSPVLAVLSSETDERTDWLRIGQALARVLLRATAANLSAGFLDQPLEVPELRTKTAEIIGGRVPQLLLRFGYGPAAMPQPRRSLDDCIV